MYVSVGGRGRSFNIEGPKTEKGAQTNSGKSATRNLESESIRCRAESTRWHCLKGLFSSPAHVADLQSS